MARWGRCSRPISRCSRTSRWAYDLDRAHVDAINADGLRLTGAGDVVGRVRATAEAAEVPRCDFGIVATKAMHTDGAIAATAAAFAEGAVASVQNGVGNEEAIARHVGRVIRGTTFPAGKILAPGVVQWDVKETRRSARSSRARPRLTRSSGSQTRAHARRHAHARRCGRPRCAVAQGRLQCGDEPVGALTGLTHGRVCERPDLRAMVSALVDEGKAVATAQGITLDADPEELIDHAARPDVAYDHKASMLQDVEARRRTEIDYLNGGIGRWAGARRPDAAERRADGVGESIGGLVDLELQQRYANVRAAMAEHDLDALIVSGSEYTGFEGAVTYLSGFQIVHRYAYVVVPPEADPFIVFPSEARVGEHGTAQIEQVFHDRPGST